MLSKVCHEVTRFIGLVVVLVTYFYLVAAVLR